MSPVAAPVSPGDVSAVRQSQAVLPQQLALLPDHVSVPAQEPGHKDVPHRPGVPLQAAVVRLKALHPWTKPAQLPLATKYHIQASRCQSTLFPWGN